MLVDVLNDIRAERARQDEKWGADRTIPSGRYGSEDLANRAKHECREAFARGRGTWAHILNEEVEEAFAERDPEKLRAELVQVAAVAVAWIEGIDRTRSPEGGERYVRAQAK